MKDYIALKLLSALIDADKAGIPELKGEDVLQNALNITYLVAGIVAVITIIVGGIMYSVSACESGSVTKAKNMILYSVIGLVVVLSAFAITNFVIGRF